MNKIIVSTSCMSTYTPDFCCNCSFISFYWQYRTMTFLVVDASWQKSWINSHPHHRPQQQISASFCDIRVPELLSPGSDSPCPCFLATGFWWLLCPRCWHHGPLLSVLSAHCGFIISWCLVARDCSTKVQIHIYLRGFWDREKETN